ncbi:hypothetical protein CBS101457_006186 [Exobasidium rhododendri]|nr:hypothetical protein CBS101457_006186 [Exobasidium rhododendri]
MSFNDLERGTGSQAPGRSDGGAGGLNGQSYGRNSNRNSRGNARGPLPLYHAPPSSSSSQNANNDGAGNQQQRTTDPEWKKLADRIGIQIFKLNSNVQGMDKLMELQSKRTQTSRGGAKVKSAGGSDRDWTGEIHDLTETTRSLVKDLSTAVKTLSAYHGDQLSSADRFTTAKLQREFETAINSFARAQKDSVKMSRNLLDGAKEDRERAVRAAGGTVDETLVQMDSPESPQQEQEQLQQQLTQGPSLAEIEFQETLIAERESEIREIESGIHELNEIFRDLGHIVQEQGGMIDNIEYNVSSIATNTGAADRELVSANDYQRKAGRRAACLLVIVGFVISVVLLAILS